MYKPNIQFYRYLELKLGFPGLYLSISFWGVIIISSIELQLQIPINCSLLVCGNQLVFVY